MTRDRAAGLEHLLSSLLTDSSLPRRHSLARRLEGKLLHCLMDTLTISLRHVASHRNQPCAVCAALFVPAEDSGSRVLSIKAPAQEAFGGLMCGGCYSKWSHGASITIAASAAS
jgi:hypothetical protein